MPTDFFSFKKDNAVLFYVGVEHSWNPDNPQFIFLKEKFFEFLKIAKNPLTVVETRGCAMYTTEAEAITQGGEIGFMALLCHTNDVPIICFEPDRGEEMNALLKEFSKDQIEYYYFARTVAQWYRLIERPEINNYLTRFLERDKKVSEWADFAFSLEYMKEVHKKLFKNELNFNNAKFFKKIENPTREDNPLKEVARASGKFRDETVVQKILEAWEQKKDLFVIYGRGHTERHLSCIKLAKNNKKTKKKRHN